MLLWISYLMVLLQIITLDKLRKNYARFEQRRNLAGAYEMFLCDDRIIPLMPSVLGSTFLRRKRHPIGIDLIKPEVCDRIESAKHVAHFFLGWGSCRYESVCCSHFKSSSVKVGKTSMELKDIVENVMHV